MAGLRKLKGKWYIRVYLPNGKEKLLPTKTRDKKLALAYKRKIEEREFLVRAKLAEDLDLDNESLFKAINQFLRDCKVRLRTNTCESYRLAMDNLSKCWGDIPLKQISSEHHTRLKQFLASWLKPGAVNVRLRAIRAFLNWLVSTSKLDRLPCKLTLIKVDEGLPKFFTPAELEKVFAQVKDLKIKAAFRVLAETGLRRSELFNCTLEDGFLHLHHTKGRRDRLVPLPPTLLPDFLLATEDPYRPNTITQAFTAALRASGIEPKGRSLHSLRHTFALREYYRTGDIYYVKGLLGHSAVTVTERYLKFPQEYLEKVFGERVQRYPLRQQFANLITTKPPFQA